MDSPRDTRGSSIPRLLRGNARTRARGALSPGFVPTYDTASPPRAARACDSPPATATTDKPPNLPDAPIAFLGAGNMARALITGLLSCALDPCTVRASARTQQTLARLRTTLPADCLFTDNVSAVTDAAVVIVCVKPAQVRDVIAEVGAALAPSAALVCVAAGVRACDLHAALPYGRADVAVVRAMPNVAAHARRAITWVCTVGGAPPPPAVVAVFEACGAVRPVDERLFPVLTAVSGSGIAYCLMLAEALADAAVRHGLPRDVAAALAAATLEGAGALARERSDAHFAVLRNEIESPGGVTVAATAALERRGFRAAAIEAVDSAMERQRELEDARRVRRAEM